MHIYAPLKLGATTIPCMTSIKIQSAMSHAYGTLGSSLRSPKKSHTEMKIEVIANRITYYNTWTSEINIAVDGVHLNDCI